MSRLQWSVMFHFKTAHNKALQSRQCTRCLSCGFAVAQRYHKPAAAYTAAERGVIRGKGS